MALRSPTQTHSYWGPYASGSLPTSSDVQVGDTAYDTSLGSLVVCTALAPSVTWTAVGSTPPASPTTAIQFNNAGAFGGSADLTYDATTQTVLLQDTSALGTRQYIEMVTGVGLGPGPSITLAEEDTVGAVTGSLTLSTDNILVSGDSVIRSENPTGLPAPLDLQIAELKINGNQGSPGYVLTAVGAGFSPNWTAVGTTAGGALPINFALDGTSPASTTTYVGAVYVPLSMSLSVASQAYLGTVSSSLVSLKLYNSAAVEVAAFTTPSVIVGFAAVSISTTLPVVLAPGWYSIALVSGTVQSFARGLYLTV